MQPLSSGAHTQRRGPQSQPKGMDCLRPDATASCVLGSPIWKNARFAQMVTRCQRQIRVTSMAAAGTLSRPRLMLRCPWRGPQGGVPIADPPLAPSASAAPVPLPATSSRRSCRRRHRPWPFQARRSPWTWGQRVSIPTCIQLRARAQRSTASRRSRAGRSPAPPRAQARGQRPPERRVWRASSTCWSRRRGGSRRRR